MATALCWFGHLTGAEWGVISATVLGLYKAADAYETHVENK